MQNYIQPQTNDTFVALFTHDLKTPINSEILAIEMLLNDKKNSLCDFHKEILNDILNAVKYMKNLTENVLCKYKAENGTLEINKQNTSFTTIVKNCITELEYILNDKGQSIDFNYPIEDIICNCDAIEIQRVVKNLICNASVYSPKNSKIIVLVKQTDKQVYFEVQDFGCGISMNKLDTVFEKYVRLANEQKTVGTGLGLYITKLIIDAHNGKINIESEPNKGTKISFSIPV